MNTKDFDWKKKLRPYIKPFLAAENLLLSMNIRTARVAGWTLNADDVIKADRQQLLKAVEEMKENPEENTYMKFAEMIDGGEGLMAHARIHNEALGKVIDLLKAKDYIKEFDNQIPREGL